jgi:hypothetical protein
MRARLAVAVRARVRRCLEGDPAAALEPAAVEEMRRLEGYLQGDDEDLRLYQDLAWLHWFRYRMLPEGTDQDDWQATLRLFTSCFLVGGDLAMPQPLFPYVVDAAAAIATRRLRQTARHELGAEADVELWRRLLSGTAEDHPSRPVRLNNLSALLLARFEQTRDPEELAEAVGLALEALRGMSDGHPNRAGTLFNLHHALWARFELTDEDADLDTAIDAAREAAAAGPDGSSTQAIALSDLRTALWARFERSERPADLDEAIRAGQRAVEVMPPDLDDRASTLSHISMALLRRFHRHGDRADLDEAVRVGREAACSTPAQDADRGLLLTNLAVVLATRFKRFGDLADLDEGARIAQEAVGHTPPGHSDRARTLNNLAGLLLLRFERTGDGAFLDKAVEQARQGVEATLAGTPKEQALAHGGLATALLSRHIHTGDPADVEEAVWVARYAVVKVPVGHADRPGVLAALGAALQANGERTGDQADLDEAVDVLRVAAGTGADDDPERPGRLFSLCLALQARFGHHRALADLDEAIRIGRAVTRGVPADHPDLGQMLNNLGCALQLRFERTQDVADLEDGIRTFRRATEIIPVDHFGRTATLANFGNALRARYQLGHDVADLDEAVRVGWTTAEATPVGSPDRAMRLNNLGLALRLRHQRTGSRADLDDAVRIAQEAVDTSPPGHPDRVLRLINLGIALRLRHELTGDGADLARGAEAHRTAWASTAAPPTLRIRAAHAAAGLLARTEEGRAPAADLLEEAVGLLPEVAPRRLERGDQQDALGMFPNLAGDAAALALAQPEGTAAQRAARALRLLEAGRAVLLSQALDTRNDLTDLYRRHPDLAERFADLRDRLDQPATDSRPDGNPANASPARAGVRASAEKADRLTRERHRLAQDLADTLAEIRAHDEFATFGLPPSVDELLAEAGRGPVVVFNVSRLRSDALLLTRDGISAVPLPRLGHDTLIRRVLAFHRALDTVATGRNLAERRAAQAVLVLTLEWLWDVAAEPVLTTLGHHRQPRGAWPRVWWSPGGLLGLLPLHAAGHHTDAAADPERRTVLDRVVSSYTPTVRALRHARRRGRADTPGTRQRALVVAMPTTRGLPGGHRLPNVPDEVDRLRRHLPDTVLLSAPDPDDGPDTPTPESTLLPTKTNVLAALSSCAIAHFCCHGSSHPADPSQSMLLLHDHDTDPLTVASLAPVRLVHAELAFLSACRTAAIEAADLVDEAIHLASAFQLAGFPHVIGTLWSISDRMAVTVADAFYTHLRTDDGPLDTARAALALHHAVRAVRDGHDLGDGRDRTRTPSVWAAYLHSGA